MSDETYYAVLNVPETASPSEIKTAFRELIKQVHPDTISNLAPYLRRVAEEKTKEITEAYSVLSNPGKRREYDRQLSEYRRQSGAASPAQPTTSPPANQTRSQASVGPYCDRCGTSLYASGFCPKCKKFAVPTTTPPQPRRVQSLGYNWTPLMRWLREHPILALAIPALLICVIVVATTSNDTSSQTDPNCPPSQRVEVNGRFVCRQTSAQMPDPQWYTKQGPDGKWYKAQGASQDEALDKMRKAWGPSQAPRTQEAAQPIFELEEKPSGDASSYWKLDPPPQSRSERFAANPKSDKPAHLADRRPTEYNSLPTGTRIEEDFGTGGHGELTVENGTNEDAVAQLCNVANDQTSRRFFVQARTSAKVAQIPEGTYRLKFTTGLNWVESEYAFSWHPSYSEFDRTFEFREQRDSEGVQYHSISVTLHSVRNGNVRTKTITREEFLRGLVLR